MTKSFKYLLISIITFITGYIYLKSSFFATQNSFEQEMILIILGTIATIAITASLLNKQSEVELEKEQRVKIFDLKSNLYFELIEFIEKIILKGSIDKRDLITLEFLTHKISTIASAEVLYEYTNLIKTIKKTSLDSIVNPIESDELSSNLATLCGKIRYDLLIKDKKSKDKIIEVIENNIEEI